MISRAFSFDCKFGLYGMFSAIGDKDEPLSHADATDDNLSRTASADMIDGSSVGGLIE